MKNLKDIMIDSIFEKIHNKSFENISQIILKEFELVGEIEDIEKVYRKENYIAIFVKDEDIGARLYNVLNDMLKRKIEIQFDFDSYCKFCESLKVFKVYSDKKNRTVKLFILDVIYPSLKYKGDIFIAEIIGIAYFTKLMKDNEYYLEPSIFRKDTSYGISEFLSFFTTYEGDSEASEKSLIEYIFYILISREVDIKTFFYKRDYIYCEKSMNRRIIEMSYNYYFFGKIPKIDNIIEMISEGSYISYHNMIILNTKFPNTKIIRKTLEYTEYYDGEWYIRVEKDDFKYRRKTEKIKPIDPFENYVDNVENLKEDKIGVCYTAKNRRESLREFYYSHYNKQRFSDTFWNEKKAIIIYKISNIGNKDNFRKIVMNMMEKNQRINLKYNDIFLSIEDYEFDESNDFCILFLNTNLFAEAEKLKNMEDIKGALGLAQIILMFSEAMKQNGYYIEEFKNIVYSSAPEISLVVLFSAFSVESKVEIDLERILMESSFWILKRTGFSYFFSENDFWKRDFRFPVSEKLVPLVKGYYEYYKYNKIPDNFIKSFQQLEIDYSNTSNENNCKNCVICINEKCFSNLESEFPSRMTKYTEYDEYLFNSRYVNIWWIIRIFNKKFLRRNQELLEFLKKIYEICPIINIEGECIGFTYRTFEEISITCWNKEKNEYMLTDNSLNTMTKVYEDKIAMHYILNDNIGLKIYKNPENIPIDVEKNIELLIMEKEKQNEDYKNRIYYEGPFSFPLMYKKKQNEVNKIRNYKQKYFYPFKKVVTTQGKFIGYCYQMEPENWKNLIELKDSRLKKPHKIINCMLLIKYFNNSKSYYETLMHPNYYQIFETVFVNKANKEIEILNLEFLILTGKWNNYLEPHFYTSLIQYIEEIFEIGGITKNLGNSIQYTELTEFLHGEKEKVGKYCQIHDKFYSINDIICPICLSELKKEKKFKELDEDIFSNQKPFAEGGESYIYEVNEPGTIAKVFRDNVEKGRKSKILIEIMKRKDILEKRSDKDNKCCYVIPQFLFSYKESYMGYMMEHIQNAKPISDLRDTDTIKELGFTRKDILEILITIGDGIEYLHTNANMYIGDLNGRNILFDSNKKIYFIDMDGMGIDNIKPEYYTDGYIDPKSKLENTITLKDDWYSFAIHAFYYLTYTHPFNGIYFEEVNGNRVFLDITERMERKLSLLGNHGIKPPNLSISWDWMSEKLKNAFLSIFEGDNRESIVPYLKEEYEKIVKNEQGIVF